MLRKLTLRWGAAFLTRAAGPGAGHEPALDVAPGVPRWLRQLLGPPGPTEGGFRLGVDGPGSRGPPSRLILAREHASVTLANFAHTNKWPWILENPHSSKMWRAPVMVRLRARQGVHEVVSDFCQWGKPWRK